MGGNVRAAGLKRLEGCSVSDDNLTDVQSRQIADHVGGELARRRISRKGLAAQAKISISTLEKTLSGRRPFTFAPTIGLEEALGVRLRTKLTGAPASAAPPLAPGELGYYWRPAVSWIEGTYLTLRPSFGDRDAIYAYRTEITWDDQCSSLVFRESERRGVHPRRHRFGASPVRAHLSDRQSQRPASADHRVASHHFGRDVRYPPPPEGGPGLAIDAGLGAGGEGPDQGRQDHSVGPNPSHRPLPRAVQEIPEASRGRPVCCVPRAVSHRRSHCVDFRRHSPRPAPLSAAHKGVYARRSLPLGPPTGSGLWPAPWQAPAGPDGRAMERAWVLCARLSRMGLPPPLCGRDGVGGRAVGHRSANWLDPHPHPRPLPQGADL